MSAANHLSAAFQRANQPKASLSIQAGFFLHEDIVTGGHAAKEFLNFAEEGQEGTFHSGNSISPKIEPPAYADNSQIIL